MLDRYIEIQPLTKMGYSEVIRLPCEKKKKYSLKVSKKLNNEVPE